MAPKTDLPALGGSPGGPGGTDFLVTRLETMVAWARRNVGVVAVLVMFAFVFGLTALLAHFGIHLRR